MADLLESVPEAIASYEYTDIAEGTGIISFYAFSGNDSTGGSYMLDSTVKFSNSIEVGSAAITDNSFQKKADNDYDLKIFNLPKNIKGTGSILMSFWVDKNTSGVNIEGYIVAKVRKWDGAAETEIASVQSQTLVTAAGVKKTTFNADFTIPLAHFKIGDTLRLTIECWGQQNPEGAGGGSMGYGQDPVDRDGSVLTPSTDDTVTTKLVFACPFRLGL